MKQICHCLLTLLSMLLISSGVSATLVERQKPVFTPNPIEAYTDGTTSMYLYNPGAKKFFCGGNSWGTQTSVGEVGYRVYFKQYLVEGAWDGTTVIFQDSCLAKSGARKDVFFDNVNGGCFVDRGSQANYYWKLEKNDVYYRLSMAEANPNYQEWQVDTHPNTYWGWCDTIPGTVDDHGGKDDYTRVFSFLPATEHNYVDWAVCSVPDVEAYYTQLDVYNASLELKAAIEAAAAKGADVSAAEAVYNNADATIADFGAAILALNVPLASATDPVDMTKLITNPSYDNNNNTGWSGTGPGFQSYNNAEFYNMNYDSYQDIDGMPKGVYMLTLQAFYRSGGVNECHKNWKDGTGYNALIYAVADGDTVTTPIMTPFEGATADMIGTGSELLSNGVYLPNNMEASAAYFKAGRYMHQMMFAVDGSTARIGLKKEVQLNTDWTIWDNWTLTYYGSKADAYQAWIDQLIEAAPKYDATEEGLWITAGMLDEYNATIEANPTATNKEELMAAKAAIEEAAAKITANVAAWKALKAALDNAADVLNDENIADGEAKSELGDYALTVELQFETLEWTTEQVVEEAEKLLAMTDKVVKENIAVGADVTEIFFVNADYSGGTKGWSGNWTAVSNGCMEAYAITWDAYQEVKDAPLGVYEVSLQGFYRVKRGSDAWDMWNNGEQKCPGHVYVNNNETEVPCIFSESVSLLENIYSGSGGADGDHMVFTSETGDSICFPNTMATASEAFAKGMYQASAFGLVAKKGDVLRLGVKGNQQADTWVIWDNFKMTYQGFKAEIIKPELQKAVDNASADKPMSADAKALLAAAVEAGNAALAQQDGKVMFNALAGLYAANDSASASVAAYAKLSEAAQDMYVATESSPASSDVVAEAKTFYAEIMDGIGNGSYKDEEIDALIVRISEMTTKLSIPAGEASDASPLDVTVAIKNPNFDKDGANSVDGWNGTTDYNFGNDDTQKGALLLEFFEKKFDMYQDIIGLPNGTYEVGVSAFCRFGNTVQDFERFQEDPNYNEAWLYAIPGNDSTQMSAAYLKHLAADAGEDKGYTGTTTITDTTLVVPNDMVSASNYFQNECLYKNSVFVKVTDGKLRIGIKKDKQIAGDWVIMDSWTLKYYGENSNMDASGTIMFKDSKVRNLCLANWDENNDGMLTKKEAAAVTDLGEVFRLNEEITSFDELQFFTGLTSISDSVFAYCEGLSSIILPNTLTHIGKESFRDCFSLTSVNLPESVTSFGKGAFRGCIKLTNVNIPMGVTAISDMMFYDCYELPSITIPNSVTSIGNMAFRYCHVLKTVTVEWETDIPAIASDVFYKRDNATLYVPYGTKALYAAADYWKEFKQILYKTYFVINDTSLHAGESVMFAVGMNDNDSVTAFQCDIYLPEGVTLKTKDGVYDISLNADRKADHVLTSVLREDGAIRVVANSLTSSLFAGNEGALFYLNIETSKDNTDELPVTIKNTHLYRYDGTLYGLDDATCSINFIPYDQGDANNDGLIVVDDVVVVLNYMLGVISENFLFVAADMNNDKLILVDDVVLIINKLLNVDAAQNLVARQYAAFETLAGSGIGNNEIALSLSNAANYTAMQFDMNLPADVNVNDIRVISTSNHNVVYRKLSTGAVRVIVTSLSNDLFGIGSQLALSFSGASAEGISITNAYASTSRGKLVEIADAVFSAGGTTGIQSVDNVEAQSDIYDISGRIVKKDAASLKGLGKGVYIMNGKKIIVE